MESKSAEAWEGDVKRSGWRRSSQRVDALRAGEKDPGKRWRSHSWATDDMRVSGGSGMAEERKVDSFRKRKAKINTRHSPTTEYEYRQSMVLKNPTCVLGHSVGAESHMFHLLRDFQPRGFPNDLIGPIDTIRPYISLSEYDSPCSELVRASSSIYKGTMESRMERELQSAHVFSPKGLGIIIFR